MKRKRIQKDTILMVEYKTLEDILSHINDLVTKQKVPIHARASEIIVEYDYDGGYPTGEIRITWEELEDDESFNKRKEAARKAAITRKNNDEIRKKKAEEEELKLYHKLHKKYSGEKHENKNKN